MTKKQPHYVVIEQFSRGAIEDFRKRINLSHPSLRVLNHVPENPPINLGMIPVIHVQSTRNGFCVSEGFNDVSGFHPCTKQQRTTRCAVSAARYVLNLVNGNI